VITINGWHPWSFFTQIFVTFYQVILATMNRSKWWLQF